MPTPSRPHDFAYAFITVILSLAVALSGAEWVLSWQAKRVQSAEKMAPGLLVYDGLLGWRMAADWRGRHRHYDFDVAYATNALGLRGDWPAREGGKRRYAVLGDSFTFGLGVDEGETFVARLNQGHPDAAFLNIGLAGYSTDQEYLYLKKHLAEWQADEVWLVAYLGNDLFDNMLGYPLQAQMAKPYFALKDGGLVLQNVPVPFPSTPPKNRPTLADLVLGQEGARRLGSTPLFRSELARRLGFFSSSSEDIEQAFPQRFAYPLSLFFTLVEAMRQACLQQGIPLKVILMPGQSLVEQPGSYSAAYQDYFRRMIAAGEKDMRVEVIDLAGRLRGRGGARQHLFHPNEGHLNPLGHQAVAGLLGPGRSPPDGSANAGPQSSK